MNAERALRVIDVVGALALQHQMRMSAKADMRVRDAPLRGAPHYEVPTAVSARYRCLARRAGGQPHYQATKS